MSIGVSSSSSLPGFLRPSIPDGPIEFTDFSVPEDGSGDSDSIPGGSQTDFIDFGNEESSSPLSNEDIVSLGERLNNNRSAGSSPDGAVGSVSEGSLTLTNGDEASLGFETGQGLDISTGEKNTVTLENQATGERLQLSTDSTLRTEGEGELTIFGGETFLEVSGGEALNVRDTGDAISLSLESGTPDLSLGDDGNSFEVSSTRPDRTDSLTVFTDRGENLSFEQGESGEVERTDDGNIRITNTDQSRSLTLSSNTEFTLLGEAEATLESGETRNSFSLEKGDDLRVSTEDEGISVTRPDAAPPSVKLETQQSPNDASARIRFETLGNADTGTTRTLTSNLLNAERPAGAENFGESNGIRTDRAGAGDNENLVPGSSPFGSGSLRDRFTFTPFSSGTRLNLLA